MLAAAVVLWWCVCAGCSRGARLGVKAVLTAATEVVRGSARKCVCAGCDALADTGHFWDVPFVSTRFAVRAAGGLLPLRRWGFVGVQWNFLNSFFEIALDGFSGRSCARGEERLKNGR
jgi:hypothetical protein